MIAPRTLVTRLGLVLLTLLVIGGGLWALGNAVGDDDRKTVTAPDPALYEAPPALIEEGAAGTEVKALSESVGAPDAQAGPNPLGGWAEKISQLTMEPADRLIAFAEADLAMRTTAPNCHLSWITLAAIGRVDPERTPAQVADVLCAGGRDLATEKGWTAGVRAIKNDTAHLHKVLALASSYADPVRHDVPITPTARAAIDFAVNQIGLPYVWGGNGPQQGSTGFDCSGLTTFAYSSAGVSLPRTAHTQYFATGRIMQAGDLQPGDLVFWGSPATKIHHVGLYLGNGVMVNAPTFGMPVQVALVSKGGRDFAGAGRPGVQV